MYNKLNITENHLKILALFTDGYPQLHIRDIARRLVISPRTVQLILTNLTSKGVLTYESKGRTILYQVKNNEIAEYYLCLAESYKKAVFLNRYFNLALLSQKLEADTAIIFGSYAKNLQKKDSDIDLFVAGAYNKKEIEEYAGLWRLDLDIKHYPKDWHEKMDVLLKEILTNHIILSGQESFVHQTLSWKYQTDLS